MGEYKCRFFNFYTEEYEGELKGYCVFFTEELRQNDVRLPMKGKRLKWIENISYKSDIEFNIVARLPNYY